MPARLASIAAVVALAIGMTMPAGAQTETATDGWSFQQVTSEINPTRTHEYPSVAVDPQSPNTVALGNIEFTSATCLTHVSTNGGQTWTPAASPQPDDYTNCGITNHNFFPTQMATGLTYAPDGTLYYAFAAAKPTDGLSRSILLSRSTDDGRSWESTVVERGEPGQGNQAEVHVRPKVAVDPNDSQRVFVAWRHAPPKSAEKPNEAWVAMSTDGGATFGEPVVLGPGDGPDVTVAPDGTAYVLYYAPADEKNKQQDIVAARSTNGEDFEKTTIFTAPGVSPLSTVALQDGTVIAAWSDSHLADEGEILQQVFSARTTNGEDWTEPQAIAPNERTDPSENVNQIYPNISASPDGRVDVLWYDYRSDPFPVPDDAESFFLGQINDVFTASSTDGGESFGDVTRVTRNPIDRRMGTWNTQYFLNARPGIASTDEGMVAAWSDTANGRPDVQAPQDIVAASSLVGTGDQAVADAGSDFFSWRDWLLAAELFVGGLGLALLVAWMVLRRRPASERERART